MQAVVKIYNSFPALLISEAAYLRKEISAAAVELNK